MDEEYEYLDNGLIHQINYKKIEYNNNYNSKYDNYGDKRDKLSYLRLGVLLGALKKNPNKILDVGYGNGDFLKACLNSIKECHGIDLSDYPVPTGCTKINNMFSEKYDVVCFFDSLEHFDDIYAIKELKTDYIFISVPWCHNFSPNWFKSWYHRRPNEHLWHFNKDSINKFFNEIGYECIYQSNFEDIVRINKNVLPNENILSCLFKKLD